MPIVTYFNDVYNCIYNEVLNIMKIDKLYFFENNPTGYLEAFVKDSPNNGTILWKYSRSKKLFYQYKCISKDTKHLPILSAILECDSYSSINLDEFINDIHIETSNYGYPSLQHILEVWSYETHIILDRTKSWKLKYMDLNINEFSLDIFNETWNFSKK